MDFKEECQTCGVHLTLAASEHQEMNGQVKVTCRTLRTIAHTLMVHARVLEAYIHFAFMYTTDHIFPVLPIKDLINNDGDPTTPFKLATGMAMMGNNVAIIIGLGFGFYMCVCANIWIMFYFTTHIIPL